MVFTTRLCCGACGAKGHHRKFEKKPLISNLVHIICFCNTLHQARLKYASAKTMNIMFQSLKSYYFFLKFLLYIADKKFTSSDMR